RDVDPDVASVDEIEVWQLSPERFVDEVGHEIEPNAGGGQVVVAQDFGERPGPASDSGQETRIADATANGRPSLLATDGEAEHRISTLRYQRGVLKIEEGSIALRVELGDVAYGVVLEEQQSVQLPRLKGRLD